MPILIGLLHRRGVLDAPNERSSHVTVTPRGAGIGMVPAVVLAVVLAHGGSDRDLGALVVAGTAFGLIGLLDDVRHRSAGSRLLLQLVAGSAVIALVGEGIVLVAAVVAVVWVVAFVNIFNFMDGANGLAGVQAAVAGGWWWLSARHAGSDDVATLGLVLAATAIGFLPFNFPRARIFLGDVGSYGVGALLALAVVLGVRSGIRVDAMVAPLALFGLDTSVTLVRRAAAGEPVFESHRRHSYQQLLDLGWSHVGVTSLMAVCMIVCSGLGWIALVGGWQARLLADAGVVAVAAGYVVLPGVLRLRGSTAPAV